MSFPQQCDVTVMINYAVFRARQPEFKYCSVLAGYVTLEKSFNLLTSQFPHH